jgi:putative endonuclease
VKFYYVYILASHSRAIYIGVTGDLDERLASHRSFEDPYSFTARYQVTKLVYVEEYTEVTEAISREKQMKGWRRAKKVMLIERDNPHWQDLAPPFPP